MREKHLVKPEKKDSSTAVIQVSFSVITYYPSPIQLARQHFLYQLVNHDLPLIVCYLLKINSITWL